MFDTYKTTPLFAYLKLCITQIYKKKTCWTSSFLVTSYQIVIYSLSSTKWIYTHTDFSDTLYMYVKTQFQPLRSILSKWTHVFFLALRRLKIYNNNRCLNILNNLTLFIVSSTCSFATRVPSNKSCLITAILVSNLIEEHSLL